MEEMKMKVKSFNLRIAMQKEDDDEINDESIETALLSKFANLQVVIKIAEKENKEI